MLRTDKARERPKPFADDWQAEGTPAPPTTVANALGAAGRAEVAALRPSSIGARFRRLSVEEIAGIPAVDRRGGIDLSPDGSEVAFAWDRSGDLEIHTTPLRGDRVIQLTDAAGRSVAPRWSPDGRWVAFLRDEGDGATALWLVDRDGEHERRLTDTAGRYADHAWSPDGKRIAFADIGSRAVHAVDVATGRTAKIADGAEPRWSPDGAWLLISRLDGDAGELVLLGARGDQVRVLDTRQGQRGTSAGGRWSPDGTMIAFTLMIAGRREVAFAQIREGSVARVERLGATPFEGSEPVWRPDGRGVVYRRHRDADVSLRRAFTVSHADDAVMDLPGTHGSAQLAPDSETVVALLGAPRGGVDIVMRPKGAVAIARITRSLPGTIDPAVLVDPVYVTDGSAGSLVYVPHAEAADGSRRAAVAIRRERPLRDWDPAAQLLADHGHAVIVGPAGVAGARRILASAGLASERDPVIEHRPGAEGARTGAAGALQDLLARAQAGR